MKFQRLRSRRTFSQTFHRGQTFSNRLLVIFVLVCPDEPSQVGFTSAKAAGSAVKRNRIRRRLRAAMAGLENRMRSGRRVIVLGKAAVLTAEWREVTKALTAALERGNCLEPV